MKRSERESFHIVKETCPAIDKGLSELDTIIKSQTYALREALVDKIEEIFDAEDKIASLEQKLRDAEQEIADLQDQIRRLES